MRMNGYEPARPRAAMGLTAAMMTAATLGTLVVLPARLEQSDAGRNEARAAQPVPAAHVALADAAPRRASVRPLVVVHARTPRHSTREQP